MGRKFKIKNGLCLDEEIEEVEEEKVAVLDMSEEAVARRIRTNSEAEDDLLNSDNVY